MRSAIFSEMTFVRDQHDVIPMIAGFYAIRHDGFTGGLSRLPVGSSASNRAGDSPAPAPARPVAVPTGSSLGDVSNAFQTHVLKSSARACALTAIHFGETQGQFDVLLKVMRAGG